MENFEFVMFMSKIVTGIFIIGMTVAFFYGQITGYRPKYFGVLDELKEGKINIGYIENDPVTTEVVKMEIVTDCVETSKKKPRTKDFLEECTASLANLGVKRAAAKRNATKFLDENPDIQTVEEFIIGIMKK